MNFSRIFSHKESNRAAPVVCERPMGFDRACHCAADTDERAEGQRSKATATMQRAFNGVPTWTIEG